MDDFSVVSLVVTVIGTVATVIGARYAVLQYRHQRETSSQPVTPSNDNPRTEGCSISKTAEFVVTNEVRTAFKIHPPSLIRSLFPGPEEGFGGFTVRNFDWDGASRIIRPCDVHLGYDTWDVLRGSHLESFELSEESRPTMYSVQLVGGVFFGNGKTVAFRPTYKPHEILPIELDPYSPDGFGVTRDRKVLAALLGDESKVAVICSDYIGTFQLSFVDTELADGVHSERAVYFSPFQGKDRSFYVVQQQSSMEEYPPQAITRHDFESRKKTGSIRVCGLQNIALSPDGLTLVAICTNRLVRLCAINLEILDEIPLAAPREHEKYALPPAQFSPCGTYLALSYSITGDVEIRDALTLELKLSIASHGIPAAPLEWSSDGRFLAGGFRRRIDGKPQLHIWSIPETECLAIIDDIRFFSPTRPHCYSPKTFYWNASKAELLLLLQNGRIQRLEYRLNE
ncbi:MAG: WD40 repeat domain-containing protein [Rhodocyclaceae bacterium]|nr:WD40 repeat domain-containing protein [Rhodocyclaceae bacterium]